jgi:subtilisin family serine protease
MRNWGNILLVLVCVLVSTGSAGATAPSERSWTLAWGEKQVRMPLAWDLTTGSAKVTVAVVDSGVDPKQRDLKGALVPGWDFIANRPTRVDRQGHGTLVASIIAARANNGTGVAGYCWHCKVMPVRVTTDGKSYDGGLTASGIRWAADHGARIISLSFSDEGAYPIGDPRVDAAIAYAARKNVLVIASAGNSGSSGFTHPASASGTYAVAATDESGQLFPWSTRGNWVHLAAPGCQLGIWPGVGVVKVCGTSVSAPAVAGIAALLLSVNPKLTPQQVVSVLEQTSVPVPGIDGGRIDAYGALLAIHARPPIRVKRGALRAHWHIKLKVNAGRVDATLRSAKAKTCSLSLESTDGLWYSKRSRRNLLSLAVKVETGTYDLEVWCKARRPRGATLTVRAPFA